MYGDAGGTGEASKTGGKKKEENTASLEDSPRFLELRMR